MSPPVRVLVVRPSRATFIEEDISLLRKHFEVRTVDVFEEGRSLGSSLKVFLRLLRGVLWSDVTYSWFADVYALWAVRLSRLMLRKSVVVVGGYEVADVPEVDYGSLRDPKGARVVRKTLKGADRAIAVSGLVEAEVRALSPDCRVETVHLGVDCGKLTPRGPKERLVVTVGSSMGRHMRLKGIDVFARASLSLPDFDLKVVGACDDGARAAIAAINSRVALTGVLPREELMALLDKAKVYCQLSMRESFGMALAESMALGCVPVVARAGALPEVVGDVGFIVDRDDLESVAEAVKKAVYSDCGGAARNRICSEFSLGRREAALERIIKGLVELSNEDIES
jgi:glycosyltransferase involved in cell wall biosynthesis